MNTLHAEVPTSRHAATEELPATLGQDGREAVYVAGLANTQEAADAVADRLSTHFGVTVIGKTAVWAFENPEELKALVDGREHEADKEPEEPRHLIATSAGTAAVVHAGIETPASAAFYEPTQETKWWKLPPKLLRLLASQSRKGLLPDPKYPQWKEEQPAYRASVTMKLKELSGWPLKSKELLKKPVTYIRLLGKIASADTSGFLARTRQKEIPTRLVYGEQNEMRLNPDEAALEVLGSFGVAVRKVMGRRADHERIAIHTDDIAPALVD